MVRNKATFRALREECGLSQNDLASRMGVSVESVKRWENPKLPPKSAPEEVWEFLLQARAALYQDAREIAQAMIDSLEETQGSDLKIRYYRSQDHLDEFQKGSGVAEPFGYANARSRKIGELLDKAEIRYTYEYDI